MNSPIKLTNAALAEFDNHSILRGVIDPASLGSLKVATVVSVNLEMPWLLGNIEPNSTAIVAGFSTRPDAVMDVLRGRFHPTGSLPITLPRNLDVVVAAETTGPKHDNNATGSDVPGFARPAADNYVYKDSDGSAYSTGFGLRY
jgi:beta-glucosidase